VVYSIPYVFSLNYLGNVMARDFAAEAEATVASLDFLSELESGLFDSSGVRFPNDITDNYITFTAKNRGKKTKLMSTKDGGGGSITLPIPSNLSTGYNAQYDTGTGIGVVGEFARNEFAGMDNSISAGAAAVEQLKAIGLSASPELGALLGGAIADKFGAGALGLGVGAAFAGAARGAAVGAGIAVNPHLAVIFSGVNFRTHQFQYKFSPRDASESDNLKNIIKKFKLNMHPSIESAAFFKYPNEFDIEFSSSHKNYLFEFGTSVLTDFQINYNPDGGSYFHDNGAPVSVGLSLTFTEIDIITQDKINEGR